MTISEASEHWDTHSFLDEGDVKEVHFILVKECLWKLYGSC